MLFSFLQSHQFQPTVELGKLPSQMKVAPTQEGLSIAVKETIYVRDSYAVVLETAITLNETEILLTAKKLLERKIFHTNTSDFFAFNVLEALKRYREALISIGGIPCYQSLYSAFEKAVNADKDRQSKEFDAAASAITTLTPQEIESLRLFYNRVKHVLRQQHPKDRMILESGEKKFGHLARNVKMAADQSILARI